MDSDTLYCRSLVETHDRDRYILSMAAPAPARAALWAVYAFNHEIAKTREVTREAGAGHVRLAWWREKLEAHYAGAALPAHDVARALGRAIAAHDLPLEAFERLLDARAFDLDGTVPATLDGLGCYVDATNTPLTDLAARILGAVSPGSDIGIAWGLTGILRALPFLAQQNRCMLPMTMMHDLGLMPEQFHHLAPSPALAEATGAIAARARAHLARAQPTHRLFRVQARMVSIYLKRVARAANNPFDPLVWQAVPFMGVRAMF